MQQILHQTKSKYQTWRVQNPLNKFDIKTSYLVFCQPTLSSWGASNETMVRQESHIDKFQTRMSLEKCLFLTAAWVSMGLMIMSQIIIAYLMRVWRWTHSKASYGFLCEGSLPFFTGTIIILAGRRGRNRGFQIASLPHGSFTGSN